jgi:hypothetical protein
MSYVFELGDWVLEPATGQEGEVVERIKNTYLVAFGGKTRWVSSDDLEALPWTRPDIPKPEEVLPDNSKVGFKDEPGRGEVLSRKGAEFLIKTPDGFERWFHIDDLIFYDEAFKIKEDEETQKALEAIAKADLFPRKVNRNKAADHKRVVDLHIHELLETTQGFTKHELFLYQLDTARHELDRARDAGIRELTLIHGKGAGKLRAALLDMLAGIERITVYDANFAEFGGGAVKVEIWSR